MGLRVSCEWIDGQNGGSITDLTIVGLYRAFRDGTNPLETPYARGLRTSPFHHHKDLPAWIERLRVADAGPLTDEPLLVRVTERGRFELMDGHHRASRYVADGIPEIPVEPVIVSETWARLVDDLRGLYPSREDTLYQEIEHPWFSGWKLDRSSERLGLVTAEIDRLGITPAHGMALDIGSCSGRFSRELKRRGFVACGVDIDPRIVRVAEYLNLVFGLRTTYYCRPFSVADLGDGFAAGDVAVALALSVYHRALAAGKVDEVARIYKALASHAKVLFVDAGSPDDPLLAGSPVPWAQFGEWLKSTVAPNVRALGMTEGRAMYSVSRFARQT